MQDMQVEEEEQRLEDEAPLDVEALRIPGSRLAGQQVLAFDRELACLAREGQWVYNATPRWLPWDLNPLAVPRQPNYRTCDILFASK